MDVMIRWTKEEEQFLIENYPSCGYIFCGEKLNRSKASIERKVMRLGIRSESTWSQEEINILLAIYPSEGYKGVMNVLKRDKSSIQRKASELKCKSHKPSEYTKSGRAYDDQLFDLQVDCFRLDDYVTSKTPIKHTCSQAHIWYARPNDILNGSGCPGCSNHGFDMNAPAILYYVLVDEQYYKIGITNNSVEGRFKSDFSRLKVIWERKYNTGREAYDEEQYILTKFHKYRIKKEGLLKQGGNTEIFKLDIMSL